MNEDDTERALRESLRAPALSAEALQRIRRATEAEWRRVGFAQQPVRRWWQAAVAASLVAVALAVAGIALEQREIEAGNPAGLVARAQAPGVVHVRGWRPDAVIAQGAELRTGQHFDVRGAALVSLLAGGNLRIAPDTQIEVIAVNTVKLVRGEMYVDIPPGAQSGSSFTVITNAGVFRHVGTQFALTVSDGATRLRVREGRVLWQAAAGDSTIDAGTEILIDHEKVTRRGVDPTAGEWAWTEALAPELDIENKPLSEFLEWVSRETGRKLVIADDLTRAQIASIRTHGDLHGLTPMQALAAVMSSTSLHLDISADVIRVSFAGETSRPPG
jgi:ferric-dicitrate binding protein FerR (iron transport regulator)